MGSHDEIDARKKKLEEEANEKKDKSVGGQLKCRRVDVEYMRLRLERMRWNGDEKNAPLALQEGMRVLQASLHVPAAVRRGGEACTGPVKQKIVGYELRSARECGENDSVAKQRRMDQVLDRSALPFEAFYRRALPELSDFFMAAIKLLVAVLVDDNENLDYKSEMFIGLKRPENDVQSQMDESRIRAILLASSFSVFLLLLRQARENSLMQYEYLLGTFGEFNLTLLLFRFLHQDVNSLCLNPFFIPDSAVHYLWRRPKSEPAVNWNYFVASVSVLRLLHKLLKHSLPRVRDLIDAKVDQKCLKKLLNCNPTVKLYALKTLKLTFRLLKQKRRLQEGALLTAIYVHLTPELNDNWLSSWYLEQNESVLMSAELVREGEARRDAKQWNFFHYRFEEPNDEEGYGDLDEALYRAEEVGKDFNFEPTDPLVLEEMMAELYDSVQVTPPTELLKWVDEKVFCTSGSESTDEEFDRVFVST